MQSLMVLIIEGESYMSEHETDEYGLLHAKTFKNTGRMPPPPDHLLGKVTEESGRGIKRVKPWERGQYEKTRAGEFDQQIQQACNHFGPPPTLGEIEAAVRRVVREELHDRDRLLDKYRPEPGELAVLTSSWKREHWQKVMDAGAEFHS